MKDPEPGAGWLLLIHQIPPSPAYLRVKVWRQLQRLGAVSIKSSVYVLPNSDQAHEDLEWVLRDIVKGGGDGSMCEARFVEGLSDDQIEHLFRAARDADFSALSEQARELLRSLPAGDGGLDEVPRLEQDLARLKRRFADTAAIDFFVCAGRDVAGGLIEDIEARIQASARPAAQVARPVERDAFRERTWVTRKGIHVDRMASGWLIRHFVDPAARFRFIAARERPRTGDVGFDMFEGEFTHDGDRCTFEVLLDRFGLVEPALRAVAELVHDIDLKDGKFGRPEAPGLAAMVAGIALAHRDDEARLDLGGQAFQHLYEYYRRMDLKVQRGKGES